MNSDEEERLERRRKWREMLKLEKKHEERKQKMIWVFEERRRYQRLKNRRSQKYSRRSESPKQRKHTK